jgi:hypothetical protein
LQLFYHLLFPLSLPVIILLEGMAYTRNHRFFGAVGAFQAVNTSIILLGNVFFFGWMRGAKTNVTMTEVVMTNIVFLIHKIMVATKVCVSHQM